MPTVLVTSAAGGVGRPLVRSLTARGVTVRALVKNDAQALLARRDGATEVRVGDMRDVATLEDAMRGADGMYHAAPTQIIDEGPIAEHIVDLGTRRGLGHLVFHSVIHPEITELPHHTQKESVEKLLATQSIPTTILRPSHYMQNYLDFWEFIRGGLMPYPVSTTSPMGVVDVEDVAEAAAAALVAPQEHIGKTYDLSTETITREAMAEAFADALGHRVTAVRLPPTAVVDQAGAAGAVLGGVARAIPSLSPQRAMHLLRGMRDAPNARGIRSWSPQARDNYVQMMSYYDSHGLPVGDLTHLPTLLDRAPTSYREFARREVARRVHGIDR
ncbi:NmrA family NAD(P)-binding protein [Williamsia sp. MIQD14]|uniref:NmrA family NAD(P)-binding protein n=1 Tax=Williamsia sp. MIQD14 TaxID=3425703 RepID=UPI003DA0E3AE